MTGHVIINEEDPGDYVHEGEDYNDHERRLPTGWVWELDGRPDDWPEPDEE